MPQLKKNLNNCPLHALTHEETSQRYNFPKE
jgi:hypothetical protein